MNILFEKQEHKNNKEKKKMMYFIVEDNTTGDLRAEKRNFINMQSKYNPDGWTYEDIAGPNEKIIIETIYKSEIDEKLKKLRPTPLGFKVDKHIKVSLEKIAKEQNLSLIEVTTMALNEFIEKNNQLL
ncbi:hypothetical protein [Tepidibacter hydrothermalis]|uniref:Uncharacterized protein n=1 Tax=Tepidibacter hydrothermalis TaxID=3036126 RepID=A0ABY8EH67_9FIRM|nr:hypothetical protein [Tepidibacter hydrothermalis]WFD12293.1 hypothetical protein P4S50_09455 [Tepidibacter hydrothermalis]